MKPIPGNQLPPAQRVKRILRRLRRPFRKSREALFFDGDWQHGGDISRRNYASYEAYVAHQKSKLASRQDMLERNRPDALASFERHFRACPQLQPRSSVLCLGARIGTEVEAFINLGHFAVGIDLEPGPGNPYVLSGDFHGLVFADDSVDAVYTNCLDHLFDLDRVAGEIARVLRPGGVALIDIIDGYEEGFLAGNFEAAHWPRAEVFAERLEQASGLARADFRDLSSIGRQHWHHLALVKPSTP